MNNIQLFFTNKYIYIPFLLWLGIQAFKVIWDLVETKKFNFKRIMGAGGMPSSHSAVVTSIATLIGKSEGVDSPIFALSVVFANGPPCINAGVLSSVCTKFGFIASFNKTAIAPSACNSLAKIGSFSLL